MWLSFKHLCFEVLFFVAYAACQPGFIHCANFDQPCKPRDQYVRCTGGIHVGNCYTLVKFCRTRPSMFKCGRNVNEVCRELLFIVIVIVGRVFLHLFSCYCLQNTRNVAKFQENSILQQFKVIQGHRSWCQWKAYVTSY